MKKDLVEKCEKLKNIISKMDYVLIALSGGVDSNLLLQIVHEILGNKILTVSVTSQIRSDDEIGWILKLVKEMQIEHHIIQTDELSIAKFRNNPVDRCYLCKKNVFSILTGMAAEKNIKYILDGSNYDDLLKYRPGRKAAQEFGIISPLQEAKFTKSDIRYLAKEKGISSWNKPSQSCFMTRFPYNTLIEEHLIKRVKKAEDLLTLLGLSQKRVRVFPNFVKIEVLPEEMNKLIDKENQQRILKYFKKLGFQNVLIDLEGYVSGSMDIEIRQEKTNE